jgi:hypothetical protein
MPISNGSTISNGGGSIGGGGVKQYATFNDFPATGKASVIYIAQDTNFLYYYNNGAYHEATSQILLNWGQITGTLSNQTDLQNALNLKAPLSFPTFTGSVTVPTPINPTDASTKEYVDSNVASISQFGANYTTTANLNATYNNGTSGVGATLTSIANEVFTTDGFSPFVNSIILVKNQTTTFQNGRYTLTNTGSISTPYILTRCVDYNSPAEIQSGDIIFVANYTVNTGPSYIQTAIITNVGVDPIVFSSFNLAPGSLLSSNNLSDVANATTSRNNIGALASATATYSIKGNDTNAISNATDLTSDQTIDIINNGASTTNSLAINRGGTGARTQQLAINNLTGPQSSGKYLRSDGTNATLSNIQAGDVPTLNQNTTGNAGSISGTNVVTNSNLTQMPANTWKGNINTTTGNATDNPTSSLTELTSSILSIIGATNSLLSPVTIQVKQSTTLQDGYLSFTDWNTFNNKQPLLTNPITSSLSSSVADRLAVFNGSGLQVTPIQTLPIPCFPAITGDVTTTAGSINTELSQTGVSNGSYTMTNLTVDAKGRITNASNTTLQSAHIFVGSNLNAPTDVALTGDASISNLGVLTVAVSTNLRNGAANNIPYQSASNTTSYIAPVNNALLVTNSSGIPSESTIIPNLVTATTQTQGDNSTKLSTTAYVDTKTLSQAISSPNSTQVISGNFANNTLTLDSSNFVKSSQSTGLIGGAVLSIGSPTSTFSLTSGTGLIINNESNPTTPIVTFINISSVTNGTVTNIASSQRTYILINSSGVVVQQSTVPTPSQLRSMIYIGFLDHWNNTIVNSITNNSDIQNNPSQNVQDFLRTIGVMNFGNVISPNGANMNINASTGSIYAIGCNQAVSRFAPNNKTITGGTAISFNMATQLSVTSTTVTILPNAANYDNAGVITANSGANGSSINHRVFLQQSGAIVIQYGQQVYANLNTAIGAISTEQFIVNPLNSRANAVFLGWISIVKNATSLNNTGQAVFTSSNIFGDANTTSGSSGTAITFPITIIQGGTGASDQQSAINALTGTQSSGKYLRSDGTNATLSNIQVADVPTLNQNTTGTASNITASSNSTITTLPILSLPLSQTTGALPITQGGTGQTTANAGLNALLPSQTGNANKVLSTDGTNSSWITSSGGSGNSFTTIAAEVLSARTLVQIGSGGASSIANGFGTTGTPTNTQVGTVAGCAVSCTVKDGILIAITNNSTITQYKSYIYNGSVHSLVATSTSQITQVGTSCYASDLYGSTGGDYALFVGNPFYATGTGVQIEAIKVTYTAPSTYTSVVSTTGITISGGYQNPMCCMVDVDKFIVAFPNKPNLPAKIVNVNPALIGVSNEFTAVDVTLLPAIGTALNNACAIAPTGIAGKFLLSYQNGSDINLVVITVNTNNTLSFGTVSIISSITSTMQRLAYSNIPNAVVFTYLQSGIGYALTVNTATPNPTGGSALGIGSGLGGISVWRYVSGIMVCGYVDSATLTNFSIILLKVKNTATGVNGIELCSAQLTLTTSLNGGQWRDMREMVSPNNLTSINSITVYVDRSSTWLYPVNYTIGNGISNAFKIAGITTTSAITGQNITVVPFGNIVTGFSGLITGNIYFSNDTDQIQDSGTQDTSNSRNCARALSSTTINLVRNP